MIQEGMDVARVNLAHGTPDEQVETIDRIRRAAIDAGATVAVLADLQGPKLRIGRLIEPLDLAVGDWISLTTGAADGQFHVIPVPHPELVEGARVGGRWLFADGAIEAVVREVRPSVVIAEVAIGGRLTSLKGIHAPGATRSVPALTDKDRESTRLAVSAGVDYVGLSFVRGGEDILVLRKLLDETPGGEGIGIVAKIERREALDDLDAILAIADAVMVARGDLGLEIPPQEVPLRQKEIIRACNRRGVPVITATQMLASMVAKPRPTRAEASDVANAILDGTDAVMLSDETAVGSHPIEAVAMIREISAITEEDVRAHLGVRPVSGGEGRAIADAVSEATARIAEAVNARLIVTVTASGYTARRVARERPHRSIVALTPDERVLRQLALVWGVVPILVPPFEGVDGMPEAVSDALLGAGCARVGDVVVVAAGLPLGVRGTTNLVKVHRIENGPNRL